MAQEAKRGLLCLQLSNWDQGYNSYILWCNDTADNLNYTEFSFTRNSTPIGNVSALNKENLFR